jgi:carbon storage regulator
MGQLILARRKDEQIVIGDGSVVITVLQIRGEIVRLGITAPRELPVHRYEIFETLQRQKREEEGAA